MEQRVILGKRLKELCEEKGYNYRTLAEKTGMPVKRVYRLVNSLISNPSVFVMLRICDGLGITLDEFFGTDEFQEFR